MMPHSFKESNVTMGKPKGWKDDQCMSVDVFRDENSFVEFWKPSYEDLQTISFGNPLFLILVFDVCPEVDIWVSNSIDDFGSEKLNSPYFREDKATTYTITIKLCMQSIADLLNGAGVWVKIYSKSLPPISMYTLDEDGLVN